MLSLDEIKEIQLREFEYIDTVCRENGLEYSIAYGTLIGAVRHKGFIPWDDDIDIMMRRDDYERLFQIIKNDKRYGLISEKENWFNWAKIIALNTYIKEDDDYNIENYGVWLDIFPLDEVPDPHSLKGKIHMKLVKLTNNLAQKRAISRSHAKIWNGYRRILWLVRHSLLSIFSIRFYNRLVYRIITSYRSTDTGFIGVCIDYWQRSFKKELFDSYMDIAFENITVRTIVNYDLFLTNSYGDYMKLPPVEQRKSGHHYKVYWK